MLLLYNLIALLSVQVIRILALFSPKMRLFVSGRKEVFSQLKAITAKDRTVWFHAASLGEFEQGLPIMEAIKSKFPQHKIVLTFFSPSGYEVRKNNTIADLTLYLPIDTQANASRFVEMLHPEMVFFIKYEFWPNYLSELRKRNIKTYLVSGIFREDQAFFKWYGGFYRKALLAFDYFFVQNESSQKLISGIGFNNVTISGDTRFDRVAAILERDNSLDFIEAFCDGQFTLVAGSTWPHDESLLTGYINQSTKPVKFILAPHNIKPEQLQNLKSQLHKTTVFFSEKEGKKLADYQVLIVDTVGILNKIYAYADLAYVGGGFGNPGVHNILEPAVFGIPVVVGPNYSHFSEATELVKLGGCLSVQTQNELDGIFDQLISEEAYRNQTGETCREFVRDNKGATAIILAHVLDMLN